MEKEIIENSNINISNKEMILKFDNVIIKDEKEIFNKSTKVLMDLKIQPDRLGFNFLRTAIIECAKDFSLLENITSSLYPLLAKHYNVTPVIVERCMRTAINSAYSKGGLLGLNNLYDRVIYKNDYRPSSSELIAIIVDKFRIDSLREKIKNFKNTK